MARRENSYQAELIKRLEARFPHCLILKNDEQYRQGIPDLTVLYGSRYALLEVKRSSTEAAEPNQEYYVDLVNDMGSFAAFIFPENEAEVLDALQHAFEFEW
jgi:hypothetical protein